MTQLLFPEEQTLRDTILKELERGRPDWDRPHSEAVVYWAKQLVQGSSVDPKVLITAAYAHDWGYIDLFPDGTSYDVIQSQKARHMIVGAERIGKLLATMTDAFSTSQIARVVHLVSVHDKLDILKDDDELMLMEADTMGALDAARVTPTYSPADNEKFLAEVAIRRRPLFVHPNAIANFDGLLQKRAQFYKDASKANTSRHVG